SRRRPTRSAAANAVQNRLHELAGGVFHRALRNIVLHGVDQLDITDGVACLLYQTCDAFVALATQADRPIDGGIFADLGAPLVADFGEIVCPDIGCTAAIGTVHHHDIFGRKLYAWVSSGNRGIIPFSDLAEKDSGQRFRGKLELPSYARDIIAGYIGTEHGWEVQDFDAGLLELLVCHRAI